MQVSSLLTSSEQLAHPKSTNELPADIERIGLGKYSRPTSTARKKRSKRVGEAIASGELTSKEGQTSETNPPKRLVAKDALIFPELPSFDLTILKRRKV